MATGIENELQRLSTNTTDDDADKTDELNCRTFFRTYMENGKKMSECLIKDCSRKLSGNSKANLEWHLTKIHKFKFKSAPSELPNSEVTLKIRMNPATVYRAYIHSWTLDGRPLASVNEDGMKLLMGPVFEAFEATNIHLDLSIPRLKQYLVKYAEAVKSEIKKEVQDNIVHVELDLARRQRKSVLGINVQYTKDDEIVVRTLCMKQTNGSHTGEYICTLLVQTLDHYNIKYSQVHSITTDNGRNVLKSVQLFSELESAETFFDDADGLNELFSESDDNNNNVDNDADESEGTIDDGQLALDRAVEMFEMRTKSLNGIRCAAHTLQLVINTAIKKTDYANKLLSKCRHVVNSFLAPNMLNLIRQQNLRSPITDCLTRWSSTFYMLERLVELKNFYLSMITFIPAGGRLNDSDWHTTWTVFCTFCVSSNC